MCHDDLQTELGSDRGFPPRPRRTSPRGAQSFPPGVLSRMAALFPKDGNQRHFQLKGQEQGFLRLNAAAHSWDWLLCSPRVAALSPSHLDMRRLGPFWGEGSPESWQAGGSPGRTGEYAGGVGAGQGVHPPGPQLQGKRSPASWRSAPSSVPPPSKEGCCQDSA